MYWGLTMPQTLPLSALPTINQLNPRSNSLEKGQFSSSCYRGRNWPSLPESERGSWKRRLSVPKPKKSQAHWNECFLTLKQADMKYMSQGSRVAEPGLWTQDTHHLYCRHREAEMKPLRWRISQVIKRAAHHAFQHRLTQVSTQMIVTTCSRHARLLLTAWPWESHWTSLGLRYFHLQNEGVIL